MRVRVRVSPSPNPNANPNPNPDSYWFGANYSCYADLPDIGVRGGGRSCRSTTDAVTDAWCTQVGETYPFLDPDR